MRKEGNQANTITLIQLSQWQNADPMPIKLPMFFDCTVHSPTTALPLNGTSETDFSRVRPAATNEEQEMIRDLVLDIVDKSIRGQNLYHTSCTEQIQQLVVDLVKVDECFFPRRLWNAIRLRLADDNIRSCCWLTGSGACCGYPTIGARGRNSSGYFQHTLGARCCCGILRVKRCGQTLGIDKI